METPSKITKQFVDGLKAREQEYFVWDSGKGSLSGFGVRVQKKTGAMSMSSSIGLVPAAPPPPGG